MSRSRQTGRSGGGLSGAAADGETGHQLIGQFRSFQACMQVLQNVSAAGPNRSRRYRLTARQTWCHHPPSRLLVGCPPNIPPQAAAILAHSRLGGLSSGSAVVRGSLVLLCSSKLRARANRRRGARMGRRPGKMDGCAASAVTPICQMLAMYGGRVFLMGCGHHWRRFVRHCPQWRRVCPP